MSRSCQSKSGGRETLNCNLNVVIFRIDNWVYQIVENHRKKNLFPVLRSPIQIQPTDQMMERAPPTLEKPANNKRQ